MSGVRKEIPPEVADMLIAELEAGMPVKKIAERHNIGAARLTNFQREHGLLRGVGKKPLDPKKKAAIVEDLRNGVKINEITRKHHVGYERIADIQSEFGLYRNCIKQQEYDEMEKRVLLDEKWDSTRRLVLAGLGVRV